MKLEEIERRTTELEDLPKREIYYFGPKNINCSLVRTVKLEGYTFKLYYYDIKGNGQAYLEMYNFNNERLFSELTITRKYTWLSSSLYFHNNISPISNKYFEFSDEKGECLKSTLYKLVLVAQKSEKYKYKLSYFLKQYAYAYMMFLFYKNESRVRATDLSTHYNVFTYMDKLISYELSDNVGKDYYPKDTIYYKVLKRYVNRQKEYMKNVKIIYN